MLKKRGAECGVGQRHSRLATLLRFTTQPLPPGRVVLDASSLLIVLASLCFLMCVAHRGHSVSGLRLGNEA